VDAPFSPLPSGGNPLADPLRFERRVPEATLVIFGANGDLAKRKLFPSLYRLFYDRRLPAAFSILGTSRTQQNDDEFRARTKDAVKEFLEDTPFDEDVWKSFVQKLYWVSGDIADATLYQRVKDRVAELGHANVLYYLSTQPSFYAPITERLGEAGLGPDMMPGRDESAGWRRIVIEKPFGHDLASARELNDRIHKVFPENDIYRIDHYLGKETVQNILAFRFGNGIFEPVWNRRYVNHVQITAAESIGVEGRGGYYQEAGALRDMIQNHMLQVMATIAMEPPAVYEPNAVRDERAKLLRSIRIMKPEDVPLYAVAGQYKGFRQEDGVNPQSQTETFAAATFFIDNWRWAGVPFHVRTGKKLPKRTTEIGIRFNSAPHKLFATDEEGPQMIHPNLLVLRIQPEEGISLRFQSKLPGSGMRLRPVSMDFNYGSSFGERSPSAYETLLEDVLLGDSTLFSRQDMVEASWQAVQPILDVWSRTTFDFPNYEPGTWGPSASDDMLAQQGMRWRSS
jgi:glucose-6-phosphate 1-dehydrogenase